MTRLFVNDAGDLEIHLVYKYESDEQFLKTMQRKATYHTLLGWSYNSSSRNAHFILMSRYYIKEMRKFGGY